EIATKIAMSARNTVWFSMFSLNSRRSPPESAPARPALVGYRCFYCFAIRLLSCIHRGRQIFLLAPDGFLAAVNRIRGGVAQIVGAALHIIGSVFCPAAQVIARLGARL